MFKITDKKGKTYTCGAYQFLGDNLEMDGFHLIYGKPEDFKIVDLNAANAVTQWLIDVGPFFDRFGSAKMNVLASTNATVKAIVQDVMVRKWVDLQRPDVGAGIDALIAIGVAGVDSALKTAILTTPVTEAENAAVRKVYFNEG